MSSEVLFFDESKGDSSNCFHCQKANSEDTRRIYKMNKDDYDTRTIGRMHHDCSSNYLFLTRIGREYYFNETGQAAYKALLNSEKYRRQADASLNEIRELEL